MYNNLLVGAGATNNNIQRRSASSGNSNSSTFAYALSQAQTVETANRPGIDTNTLMMYMLLGDMGGGYGSMMTAMLMDRMGAADTDTNVNIQDANDYYYNNALVVQPTQVSYNASMGESVLNLAKSRLGDPYSQARAGQGNYTDCSYLSQWCYRQVGVNLPRTAAEQARYCAENGMSISKEDLQPGDLVFFSHGSNGRYKDITHVAVYAGNGMVVDASSSRGQVVNRQMLSGQVMYARPK